MLDTPLMLVELSVLEQRYQAVSLVVHDGESVVEVARRFGVSRQTVHAWLSRYERGGLAALADRSHRPKGCAHQMPASVEAVVLEMRRVRPEWGPRRRNRTAPPIRSATGYPNAERAVWVRSSDSPGRPRFDERAAIRVVSPRGNHRPPT
jgi:transposase-like protein